MTFEEALRRLREAEAKAKKAQEELEEQNRDSGHQYQAM
jgi:hypothetical protein